MNLLTTPTAPDTTDRVKANAEIAAKSAHTWVYTAITLTASGLLYFGQDAAVEWLKAHQQAWALPLVGWAFVILAAIVPQNILLASDKAAMRAEIIAWALRSFTVFADPKAAAPIVTAVQSMSASELKKTASAIEAQRAAEPVGIPKPAPWPEPPASEPVAAPVPAAPAQNDFADTQQIDIPLEPTPPLPPAVLAAAQLVARTRGLLAANRMLAPELTDDEIRAEIAKPPAAPLGSIYLTPAT